MHLFPQIFGIFFMFFYILFHKICPSSTPRSLTRFRNLLASAQSFWSLVRLALLYILSRFFLFTFSAISMLETESLCFLCRYFLPHMSRCLAYFVCAPSLYFGHITLYLPPWKNFSVMQIIMLKQWDWTRGLYRCFEIGPTVTPVQYGTLSVT